MDLYIQQVKDHGYSNNDEYVVSYEAINEQLNDEIIAIDYKIAKLQQQIKSLNDQKSKLSQTITNNQTTIAILQSNNDQEIETIKDQLIVNNDKRKDYWTQIKTTAIQILAKTNETIEITDQSNVKKGAKRPINEDNIEIEDPIDSGKENIKNRTKRCKNTKFYTKSPYTLK